MTENLQKAYDAYQQALVNLRDPKVSIQRSKSCILLRTST